ncbi:hypothetical protein [Novosphingobium sp. 9]|uniref:hypothetical protein n=1 Tax=Novosphingobium sp. 9 TaxID=2025349 RepID=UPI0021B51E3E|nr:hypothetical protein [Novosphingobium sp. 9]
MQDTDYLVMKELMKILIRKGIITEEDISVGVDELARISQTASTNLHMLALEASSMSASEFEADYRRRQMRERTAWLEKQAQRNGGKSED